MLQHAGIVGEVLPQIRLRHRALSITLAIEGMAAQSRCCLQAGAKRKDIQQQALAVRLLHALFGASSQAEGNSTAHNIVGWADELVPGVSTLAQLLVVDTSATLQDKSKQSVGQFSGQPAGQVDRAALQLEAAYLLHIVLDGLSPQVPLPRILKAGWL